MPTQKKIDSVKALSDKLGKTTALFITDYRGLTHKQLETLRKSLKKVQAEMVVAKNTLMRIAMRECKSAGMRELGKELKNPTATLFSYADPLEAIKALAAFIKEHSLPKVKIGWFEGKLASEKEFTTLASLPGRHDLIATLALRLKSPMYGLHNALRWNLQKLVVGLDGVRQKKT